MKNIKRVSEKELQELSLIVLSEPSEIRQTASGKRLQILSPGRLNPLEGPDFLDIAILLDGFVVVGDGEFHKKSSDWNIHRHSNDTRYKNVILHIVLEKNIEIRTEKFETLVLSESELLAAKEKSKDLTGIAPDINSLEELQHYALLRLLRKTADAQKLINNYGIENAVRQMTADYIDRYMQKRTRHLYRNEILISFADKILETPVRQFLDDVSAGACVSIPDMMQTLIKHKLMSEGAHFRRELILNCILPIAVCLASEEARINLFLWYWSTPALNSYGLLKRRFADYPQNFIWQQQGMLEYIKEHGRRANIMADAIKSYGFAEVLSFYRLGRSPYFVGDEE